MQQTTVAFREEMPGLIVTQPEAAMYSVLDFRNLVDDNFDAETFVKYCAQHGNISLNGRNYTLLLAPMSGFYANDSHNHGRTQMRLAYVNTPEETQLIPEICKNLLNSFLSMNH